ncbi:hypothetical protein [Beggiatoa leptomitoformis]|uniref:Uncharacterized protein n=1 Tax=Beggiatoa leptomitoformis TaxID=288004 RepID=A0A2N9YA95_9GAMM|nr:hypothetical protein [Beggiatoa leptomitoformis]ALG67203.1 hypothetical protein AL038_05120 [Beggiatoa leptomitoformis]AUI67388.1 hypothetical protein BLE401_00870 [Beggiatoa leptomitoformis]
MAFSFSASSRRDWSILHVALIVFGIGLCISVAMLLSCYWYLQSVTVQLNKEKHGLAVTKETRDTLANTLNQLQPEDYQFFNQLTTAKFYEIKAQANSEEIQIQSLLLNSQFNEHIQGLIGKIQDVQGTIKNTEAVPYSPLFLKPPKDKKDFFLFKTRYTLNINIIHELDLLDLLEQIQQDVPTGLFNLAGCQINRLVTNPQIDYPLKANFTATCVMYWYTLYIEREKGDL